MFFPVFYQIKENVAIFRSDSKNIFHINMWEKYLMLMVISDLLKWVFVISDTEEQCLHKKSIPKFPHKIFFHPKQTLLNTHNKILLNACEVSYLATYSHFR